MKNAMKTLAAGLATLLLIFVTGCQTAPTTKAQPVVQHLTPPPVELTNVFGAAISNFEFTVYHDTRVVTLTNNIYLGGTSGLVKASNGSLEPGHYRAMVVPILRGSVTRQQCRAFLSEQGAILVGAGGLVFLKDKLPVGKWTASIPPESESLVPLVFHKSKEEGGGWWWDVRSTSGWYNYPEPHCLLCVSKK